MAQAPTMRLVEVAGGALTVMHRPKYKNLPRMRAAGVTHLVTLLSKREGALAIGTEAKAAGLEWIWVNLPNGQQPPPERHRETVSALTTAAELLRDGATVAVHCSAGVHRTGMFTYALLRTTGLDASDAMTVLTELRPTTADEVGEHRLVWAEELAVLAIRRRDAASR